MAWLNSTGCCWLAPPPPPPTDGGWWGGVAVGGSTPPPVFGPILELLLGWWGDALATAAATTLLAAWVIGGPNCDGCNGNIGPPPLAPSVVGIIDGVRLAAAITGVTAEGGCTAAYTVLSLFRFGAGTVTTVGREGGSVFSWYLGVWCEVRGIWLMVGRPPVVLVMAGPIMPWLPIMWMPWGVCTIVWNKGLWKR